MSTDGHDLLADVEWHVRGGLGGLPEARADELVALAIRPLDGLPLSELEALASDPDRNARWALLCNPAFPTELLARFADDESSVIRFELVCILTDDHQLGDIAPLLPTEGPRDLAGDPAGMRAWLEEIMAEAHPESPAARAHLAIRERSAELAAIPGVIGDETLTAMASSWDPEVRWAVASHLACPPETLAVLAADPDPGVRAGVAGNRGTPGAALMELAADPEERVRVALAHNPVLPPAVLDAWSSGGMPADPDARWSIVTHPGCPAPLLDQLAGDASVGVRAQVAWHRRTSAETLAVLVTDPDPLVRRTAIDNPSLPNEYRQLARLV